MLRSCRMKTHIISMYPGLVLLLSGWPPPPSGRDTVHKVHLAKKLRALELLAKHFALLTDVVKVDFEQSLLDRVGSRQTARC